MMLLQKFKADYLALHVLWRALGASECKVTGKRRPCSLTNRKLQRKWLAGWIRPFPDPQHISWLSFIEICCETQIFPKALNGEGLGQNKEGKTKSGTDSLEVIPKPLGRLKLFMLNISKMERPKWTKKSFPCLPNTMWQGGSRSK